jgi:hypothetical protein
MEVTDSLDTLLIYEDSEIIKREPNAGIAKVIFPMK